MKLKFISKFTVLIALIMSALPMRVAAEEVQVGFGTTMDNSYGYAGHPLGTGYCSIDAEYLIPLSDLVESGVEEGVINSISFQFGANPAEIPTGGSQYCTPSGFSYTKFFQFRVFLAEVDLERFSTSASTRNPNTDTTLKMVYSRSGVNMADFYAEQHGESGKYSTGDWITFYFDEPFEYAGTGAILIKICQGRCWYNSDGGDARKFRGTTNNPERAFQNICFFDSRTDQCSSANNTNRTTPNTFKPNVIFDIDMGPTVKEIFPCCSTVFSAGPTAGSIITPSVTFKRKIDEPKIELQFIVRDNSGNPVYEARDPNNLSSNWIQMPAELGSEDPILYTFTNAVGARVDNSTGTPRLSFRSSAVRGGYYTVEARVRFTKDGVQKVSEKIEVIEILYDVDIAIVDIVEPLSFETSGYVYPLLNAPIRFQSRIQNVGKTAFKNYDITYTVYNELTGSVAFDGGPFVVRYRDAELIKDQELIHTLNDSFNPINNLPGNYRLVVDVALAGVEEFALTDNSYERVFRIDYPYDGQVQQIQFPTSYTNQYAGHVNYIKAVVANQAAFVSSGVGLKAVVTDLSNNNIVFAHEELIEFMPAGGIPVTFEFYRPLIIDKPGSYQLVLTIDKDGDANPGNNEMIMNFNVLAGMAGEYRIGEYDYNADFTTIEEAISELYRRGIHDSVTFILTDPVYNVGSLTREYALDLSSSISSTFDATRNRRVVRFVPSAELRYSRNSININLLSRTGIGMYIAAGLENNQFANAPVNLLHRSLSTLIGERQKDFYAQNTKIEFDGGPMQAISIGLAQSTSITAPNRIPIMLGIGANNFTLKNCIIRGTSLPSPQVPSVLYDAKFNMFTFNDFSGVSAAILLRNSLPVDHNGMNSKALDTILINNINIDKNYIEGGSFGIMSLGIGPLYDVRLGYYASYYNINNRIVNNQMNSFDVAGIMLGYEKGTQVLNNEIYVVGLSSRENTDVAGIMLGGFGKERTDEDEFLGTTGYNNLGVRLEGNEISKIYSNRDAYGIKIEQEFNSFVYSQVTGNKYFTNHNDSMDIFNNVIWNIQTTDTNFSGSRYGVRLFASRVFDPKDRFEEFSKRRDTNYTISHTRIINNTIVLQEDDNRKVNNEDAYIAGVVVQDIDTITMYNNAIAVLDQTNSSDIVAAVVVQSKRPNNYNVKFDANNNVYYTPDMSVIRFIEQSSRQNTVISNPGYRDQFLGLEQWIYMINAERVSSVSNFYPDLHITKGNPQSLRISSPAPIGSYLGGRGRRIDYVPIDIYGNVRGSMDQEYDIGAWAFISRAFENDLGVLNFVTPISARNEVDEAEHVMTTAPVDVVVNVRNNGSTPIRNRNIALEVYQINDNTGAETLIGTYRTDVNVVSSETMPVSFDISKIAPIVFPRTYNELGITNIPARFRYMANNVTPKYRFKVILPSDQDTKNDTNSPQKIVRYYLKKSNISAIVSADNTTLVPFNVAGAYITGANPNADTNFSKWIEDNYQVTNPNDIPRIGGYLNFKALEKGLRDIDYRYQTNNGFDVIDRSVWEANSLNYSMYRYLFWSDAADDELTEVQERDINAFMQGGSSIRQKNIIFSSEEIARNSYAYYTAIGENDFVRNLFGTTPRPSLAGLGVYNNLTYEPNNDVLLTGNVLFPSVSVAIKNTDLILINPPKDVKMKPAIFENYGNNVLSSLQAIYYTKPLVTNRVEKTFGLISFTPQSNSIYLGVDWRHYSDPSIILAAIIDYLEGLNEDLTIMSTELVNFDANVINNKVVLDWETASEINTNRFIVEKMNPSENFAGIYETEARKSNVISNLYTTTDVDVAAGNTYTYRLKSINTDGSHSYSNEKSISIDAASNFVSLDKPTPNPVTSEINVTFGLSSESNVKLYIMDITGKEVAVLIANQTFSSGNNKLSFSLDNLASGSYNLVLDVGGNLISHSFNVVK